MIRKCNLLAGGVALVFAAGSARAENDQFALGHEGPALPAAGVSTSAGSAPASPDSSAGPLGALIRDWHVAGFNVPGKPAQARVYGRNGHVTSGGEYFAMVSLLRSAIRDCAEGRHQDVLGKIARVRALLIR